MIPGASSAPRRRTAGAGSAIARVNALRAATASPLRTTAPTAAAHARVGIVGEGLRGAFDVVGGQRAPVPERRDLGGPLDG